MKTYTLDISSDDIFDFDILGIITDASHYQVIHELNRLLDIDLVLQSYLDFTHKEGHEFLFPLYQFIDKELYVEYNLIPNQTSFQPKNIYNSNPINDLFSGEIEETTKLLPELDHTDYFLILKGDNRISFYASIFEQVKKSTLFTGLQEIFPEDIKDKKSKGNLLF